MGLMDMLNGDDAEAQFDKVVQSSSHKQLGAGLAGAIRSGQTPPFGHMVGQLFGYSSCAQQAGVLNQILGSLGPVALSGVAGGVLVRILTPGQSQLTPDQASQLSTDQVPEIAAHAEIAEPDVIDRVSQFYAQHAGLIKLLGGAALMVVLTKMKDNATRG